MRSRKQRTRHGFIVAGMHRSGTSALTRVLSLMGCALPASIMQADERWNPTGFWESTRVVNFNDRLLARFGLAWDDPRTLSSGWFSHVARELDEASQLIASEFGKVRAFVLKDPRLCRFLKLWIEAVRRVGARPFVVLQFRHPLEVAASLAARDGFQPDKSLLLWLRHVIDVERDSRHEIRALVEYADLMADWRIAIQRLYADLGLRCRWSKRDEAAIGEFLSPALHHHRGEGLYGKSLSRIANLAMTVYDALRARDGNLSAICDSADDEIRAAEANGDFMAAGETLVRQRVAMATRMLRAIAAPRSECLRRELSSKWYLQHNPDVERAGLDPYEHWLSTGADEGRQPAADIVELARELVNERERAFSDKLESLSVRVAENEAQARAERARIDADHARQVAEIERKAEAQIVELRSEVERLRQQLQLESEMHARQLMEREHQLAEQAAKFAAREQQLRQEISELQGGIQELQQQLRASATTLVAQLAQIGPTIQEELAAYQRQLGQHQQAMFAQLTQQLDRIATAQASWVTTRANFEREMAARLGADLDRLTARVDDLAASNAEHQSALQAEIRQMRDDLRPARVELRKIGLFTIASKNYLAYVRTLLSSVARLHPEYELFLCLVDRVDGYFDAAREPYRVIRADQLEIPTFSDMVLRYDVMELNTAVKPYMFLWLFAHTDLDAVVYLDPDIRVYARFSRLEDTLRNGASIVLTPHILAPLEDGKTPNDHHMLQSGVFNLGFIAARRCKESREFLLWWSRRLAVGAVSSIRDNLFTDQRWCDLAPCFLQNLHVLREPGYNVAYWNLAQRRVERGPNSEWVVDGSPLVFFHFSGIMPDQLRVVSKHQDRLGWEDIGEARTLFEDYRNELEHNGWSHTKEWPYAYSEVASGIPLVPILRLLYRSAHPDPYIAAPEEIGRHLVVLANEVAEGMPTNEPWRITRLMRLVYQQRPDVQAVFNIATPSGREGLANWFASAGGREYGLPAIFTQPRHQTSDSEAIADTRSVTHPSSGVRRIVPANRYRIYNMLQRADELFLNRMYRNLPQSLQKHAKRLWRACVQWSLAKHDAANVTSFSGPQAVSSPLSSTNDVCNRMNSPASLPQGQLLDEYRISNLMYIIWLSRPDLQRAFDLSTAAGQRDFVNWYLCSVEREYGIAPNVPGAGAEAPSHLENRFQFSADGGRGRLLQLIAGENGANLVAYAHAEMGMGELVRMSAAALSCTDVNFGIVNFDYGTRDRKTAILPHGHLEPDNRYKVNIFHINADQMLHAYCGLGGEFFSGRYNIGFWTCELEKCPDAWVPVIGMVDEIWAPSRFIQAAFAARASVPVIHMPLCVWVPDHGAHSREHFGLPSHRFLFLFTFDGFSYPERKNPIGVVRAFRHAFPDPKVEVGLVLKAMNCDKSSEAWMKLQEVIAADPRIVVIDQTMDRGELLGLVGVCDCYVSLHRSEGFARGAAEAMYLGKPVIVTNYSGPTDFVRPDNACLVSFRLVPVNAGEYPFHEGQTWADPDLDEAAWYMKKIFTDREFARKIGTCARSYMQENFSRRVVGARYADRLRELGLA